MNKTKMQNYFNKDYSINKICTICGDTASGYHHRVLACESCKMFFRRNVTNLEKLKCRTKSGKCKINFQTRKCCPKCRLDKCFSAGMRQESVKYQKSCSEKAQIASNSFENNISNLLQIKLSQCTAPDNPQTKVTENFISESNQSLNTYNLGQYERKRIEEVSIASCAFGQNENTLEIAGEAKTLIETFGYMSAYANRVIRFCKNIGAFSNYLKHEDRLRLIKGAYFEILTVRFAYFYDELKDGYPVIENETGNRTILIRLNLLNQSNKHKHLLSNCRKFYISLKNKMENDPIIRDLISALLIFKSGSMTSCPEYIRNQYFVYSYLLRRYLEHKHQNLNPAHTKYLSLISQLNEIKENKRIMWEIVSNLDPDSLSSVLMEIF